jgi:enamine deaminase RidA (YjgF/YER057c/UK114 family)
VVKVTTYFVAGADRGPARAARRRLFGDALPASSGVEVHALADPDWLLEVDAIAVVKR